MKISIYLLFLGLNSFGAGYDTQAIKECVNMAEISTQRSLNWEYESGDGFTKQSYIAQTNTSDVVVYDNGLGVELKINVISYTLNDDGSQSNANFMFDAIYNSTTATCTIDTAGYNQAFCNSNCIK